jgi:hypothetical protein
MPSPTTEAFSPAGDVSPALWISEYLANFDGTVGSIVPACFESYARVFHPAWLLVAEESQAAEGSVATERLLDRQMARLWPKAVRWAEVAAANGREMHPLAQWGSIRGPLDYSQSGNQPGLWDSRPEGGSPPPLVAQNMVPVLQRFTHTPEACWYGVSDIWGMPLYDNLQAAPKFHTPFRSWFLLGGDLESALISPHSDSDGPLCDLWWPDDRAWFVGSDVDLRTTYVGGSEACISALLQTEALEVLAVSAADGMTLDSDPINPLPPHDERYD